MMGCEGCFQTAKAIQERLQSIVNQAQKYADSNNKTVVIYQLPDGEYSFMEQEKAGEAARHYADFMQRAADEICGAMSFTAFPTGSFVPEQYRGKPALCIIAAYAGPLALARSCYQNRTRQ